MLKEADDTQITERLPKPCIKACLDYGEEKMLQEKDLNKR